MLRLMDANIDRLSEGLRVLEDVARFVLGDIKATETLKRMRHELIPADPALKSRLLAARDSESDIGRESPVARIERKTLIDLVAANARRAQESLRVLEEFAKLPDCPPEIASRNFEQARFTLYQMEKTLVFGFTRQNRRERIAGLYVIIDAQTLAGRLTEIEATGQALKGGARLIQYRDKARERREMVAIAGAMRGLCAEAGALFIMNDCVDVALAIDADGVHLGQEDLPFAMARTILPPHMILGCSARTVEQAIEAEKEGADYLGVGAIFASPTKPGAEAIGLHALKTIKKAVTVPVVAIGGITEENAHEVIGAGADAVAVIGAVLNSVDIASATRRLATRIA